MRKLFGLLSVLFTAFGGIYLMWPDQFMAHWNSLTVFTEHQFTTEMETLDLIRSGKLKIGDTSAKSGPDAQVSAVRKAPAVSPPPRYVKKREQVKALEAIAPQSVARPIIPATPAPAVTSAATPADSTPEAALGAILRHEVRENQAKEETFWTEERIQEALKNGAPKSRSAPCIAFCGDNNNTVEINMPKTPPERP
ncbi:MAG: hypothetical protein ABL951_04595 [Alphaproteobacteria bacterium]